MKKLFYYPFILILAISCSESSIGNDEKIPDVVYYDIFPMQIGNLWTYEYSIKDDSYGYHRKEEGYFTWEITDSHDYDSYISYTLKSSLTGKKYDYYSGEDRWDTTSVEKNQDITITEQTVESPVYPDRELKFSKVPYPFKQFRYCYRYAKEEEAPNGVFSTVFFPTDGDITIIQIADSGLYSVKEGESTISIQYVIKAELVEFKKTED